MLDRAWVDLSCRPVWRWLGQVHGLSCTADTERFLLAVALQESGCACRVQFGGPALSFWQFERAGVAGVFEHGRAGPVARDLARVLRVPAGPSCHGWLEFNDQLAAGLARLLLWTDPGAVPVERFAAWDCYRRLWRPGRPRPSDWAECWGAAIQSVEAVAA